MADLYKNIREVKSILYGNSESEPLSEPRAQMTREFLRENTLRLLIICLPKLNLEPHVKRLLLDRCIFDIRDLDTCLGASYSMAISNLAAIEVAATKQNPVGLNCRPAPALEDFNKEKEAI
ncbi:hypothetical protein CRG98_010408 [Punica granatum]|uniref:Uncharacterized protein n=1 Tax=Punica granatum TaxID=22663 RepID=A0A2I0KLS9_PUNGR|nr:hypothetical protein CRG98_010408 [Punica granatum]